MSSDLREQAAELHARFCGGLADQTRMLLVLELSAGPRTVNSLAEAIDSHQSAVSRHLKILRERGIVTAERNGRYVEYAVADQRIIEALNLFRAIISEQLQTQASLARTAMQHS